MESVLVSVVVTTRNEEKNIVNCLKSIRLQTWDNIEIIVVDNQSSDNTTILAREYADVVVNKGPERSAQRNYGISEIAKGTYAMFLDADMMLTPRVIEECVSSIEEEGVVALHIDEVVLGTGWLGKVRRFERSFYSGTVIDGVRFFRREIFNQIGGFDETLPPGPEDWDLDKRFKQIGKIKLLSNRESPIEWSLALEANKRGVIHESTFVGIYHNEAHQTLRRYLEKKSYYSGSMLAYQEKWPNDIDVSKQMGIVYRYFLVFFENQKWKKVLRHPILFLSTTFLRVLVGSSYLLQRARSKKNIY